MILICLSTVDFPDSDDPSSKSSISSGSFFSSLKMASSIFLLISLASSTLLQNPLKIIENRIPMIFSIQINWTIHSFSLNANIQLIFHSSKIFSYSSQLRQVL